MAAGMKSAGVERQAQVDFFIEGMNPRPDSARRRFICGDGMSRFSARGREIGNSARSPATCLIPVYYPYSTVTDLARFLGLSTSVPFFSAAW